MHDRPDSDTIILTCAVTGAVTTKAQCPAIPYTAEEIGEECRRAYEAGATIVHVHGRTDDGQPTYAPSVFAAYRREIEKRCPILINFSTGAVGIPLAERVAHVVETRPFAAALNMGSMNYAKYSASQKRFVFSHVFANSFEDIIYLVKAMAAAGVHPECECFDTGHVRSLEPLLEMGLVTPPIEINLVMGVLGGIAATPAHLGFQVAHLPPGAVWKVTPISHDTWTMASTAIGMGGHVRVGLEDNFYLPGRKMARSNGELVENAALMARAAGRRPATVEETRRMLLGGRA
jgi:uncharacterized protein (DUF849 family)